MNIGNLVKIAISSLFRNKMRTALTMLGIIIGIASVIAMVSIGQASTQSVKSELSSMGSNMIMIMPARQHRGGVDMGMSSNLWTTRIWHLYKRTPVMWPPCRLW